MYISRKILDFLIVFLFFYLILVAIFSPTGLCVNRNLKNEISRINKIVEKQAVEIDAINREIANSEQEDNLNDIAFSLGYKREGSQVYYFDTPDIAPDNSLPEDSTESQIAFRGIDNSYLAVIAFVLAALVAYLRKKFKRVDKNKVEIKEEFNDYSDY